MGLVAGVSAGGLCESLCGGGGGPRVGRMAVLVRAREMCGFGEGVSFRFDMG